ncbi:MAG: hypothetical protein FJ037_08260 [Chloroflexi bacterium]|nr:hypothetical protein [Chloroflexota bacterium]
MASEDAPTHAETERHAQEAGLHHLTPEQMDEFARAGAYIRELLAKLPRDLAVTDEPAHIFHADEAGR